MLMLGSASTLVFAQIVAAPGSGAQVIQTQNGLNQVNIARPSAAGVSVGTFLQFDVPKKGAILNNSPTIVQSQQGGYINGNPNLTPGSSARIIVNQVISNSPSQLKGYLEVAGQKAEVVVANPNGIVVDGAGFLNTSRAVLTTGTPNFGPNGSLTGFNVSQGDITVQGAGLNATNVDQVDLLARAIQVNAAIYANNLNVLAGSSVVDYATLATTPIAGTGAAPSVAIDVSQLGGMYSNRIFLASNEYGVGVSTRGVLAAQAGDLTLKSNGQLVLAGTTQASGSISASATQGIDNSGTTYAQRDAIISTSGPLTNSGTLAAQQDTSVNAASVASTGTLGAGISRDGSIATGGDLTVVSSGTGRTRFYINGDSDENFIAETSSVAGAYKQDYVTQAYITADGAFTSQSTKYIDLGSNSKIFQKLSQGYELGMQGMSTPLYRITINSDDVSGLAVSDAIRKDEGPATNGLSYLLSNDSSPMPQGAVIYQMPFTVLTTHVWVNLSSGKLSFTSLEQVQSLTGGTIQSLGGYRYLKPAPNSSTYIEYEGAVYYGELLNAGDIHDVVPAAYNSAAADFIAQREAAALAQ